MNSPVSQDPNLALFNRVRAARHDTDSKTAALAPDDEAGYREISQHTKAEVIEAGNALLGAYGGRVALSIYDIVPDIDREIALIEHDLLDSSKPIEAEAGESVGIFARALEVVAKATQHTYVGTFNETLLILTPDTTADDAVKIWSSERK